MALQQQIAKFTAPYQNYFVYNNHFDMMYHFSIIMIFISMIGAWLQYWGININYGRGSNSFLKININGKIAWFIWQLPNLVIAAYFLFVLNQPLTIGFALFIIHYVNRDLIFPFILAGSTPVPLQILISGLFFTTCNGFVQSVSNQKNATSITSLMILGLIMFFSGMALNLHSDHILRKTRAQSQKNIQKIRREDPNRKIESFDKYKVIDIFLFKYVCCPNYLGQIIEWFGYFLVCQTKQSLLFGFSTLFILTAMACNRNKWSKENIKDYPNNRKAVIPFVI